MIGEGRLSEPEEIIESIVNELRSGKPLLGKRIMVTAGPTFEPIDPVRFIEIVAPAKWGLPWLKQHIKPEQKLPDHGPHQSTSRRLHSTN